MVTETETVAELVEVYKPLPKTLTDPLPYPPGLPEGFTVDDMFDLMFALFDTVDTANADRADSAELTQPTEVESVPE